MDMNSNVAKIINGNIITPSKQERKSIIITNPTDDVLKAVRGYKDIDWGTQPEYDPETQYLRHTITETDDSIIVEWTVENILEFVEENEEDITDDSADC